jgi:Fe-S-cluster-containing hydrogenase component 2
MEALHLEDEVAVLDADKCIGCGLCVTTCPSESLTLVRKPESEQADVPRNVTEAVMRLGKERGKMSAFTQAHMRLKSKMDRLLASK